jgi:hypothetical protein
MHLPIHEPNPSQTDHGYIHVTSRCSAPVACTSTHALSEGPAANTQTHAHLSRPTPTPNPNPIPTPIHASPLRPSYLTLRAQVVPGGLVLLQRPAAAGWTPTTQCSTDTPPHCHMFDPDREQDRTGQDRKRRANSTDVKSVCEGARGRGEGGHTNAVCSQGCRQCESSS